METTGIVAGNAPMSFAWPNTRGELTATLGRQLEPILVPLGFEMRQIRMATTSSGRAVTSRSRSVVSAMTRMSTMRATCSSPCAITSSSDCSRARYRTARHWRRGHCGCRTSRTTAGSPSARSGTSRPYVRPAAAQGRVGARRPRGPVGLDGFDGLAIASTPAGDR